ncbi:MAG: hypothetical protein HKN68_03825 [Saprospiraceae bacterium]|nr:hypothetical protein [Saprospiraceae bacterium]
MQNYTLSREQSQALEVISNNDLSCILYLDKVNLATSLINFTHRNLLDGKRNVLFIESEEVMEIMKDKVTGTSFEHLYLFLSDDDFLDEQDLARLRIMAKDKVESDFIYQDTVHQLSQKEKRIIAAFEDAAEKIFGERKWRDLVLLPRRTDKVLNTLRYQLDLKLNQQEFWHIRGVIEEAKSLYDAGHLMSESIASIFGVTLDNEEKIQAIRVQLIDFRKRLLDVILSMDVELDRYKNRIHQKLEEEYLQVTHLLEQGDILIEKIIEQEQQDQSGSFTFFSNKKSAKSRLYQDLDDIKKQLSESILIQVVEITESQQIESWNHAMGSWKKQLGEWKSNRDSITSKMIRSLNKNNSDTAGFKDIDQALSRLLGEINEIGLFKEQVENTSLNTYQQYLQSEKLLQQIRLALAYLSENLEIIIWENFYNNLPFDTQQLIAALKKHELKDWIPLFEKWYLDRLLEKHFNPDSIILQELIVDYRNHLKELDKLSGAHIDSLFHKKRMKSMELARTRSKDLYNKMFKKKNVDDLRAFDIIWAEKEMLTHFFPVMVISTKLLRSNRLLNDGNWDQLYCERTEIFTHIEKYRFLEHKICFLSPLAESFKTCNDLNIGLENKKILSKLLIHEYNFSQPIEDMPISDRLRAAKKLSKILLSLNQNVRIFQMRDANIISILPLSLNQQILNVFDEHGIKEIIPEESLYETVTESIIATERTQYLLFQDHLLSLDQFQHFIWQIEALEAFENSGFKSIHIDSVNLKHDLASFEETLKSNIVIQEREEVTTLPQEA